MVVWVILCRETLVVRLHGVISFRATGIGILVPISVVFICHVGTTEHVYHESHIYRGSRVRDYRVVPGIMN